MLFKCQGFLGSVGVRGQGQSPPCAGMGSPSAGHWAPPWEKSRQICGELETSPAAELSEQELMWGPRPWGITVGWEKDSQGWWYHQGTDSHRHIYRFNS